LRDTVNPPRKENLIRQCDDVRMEEKRRRKANEHFRVWTGKAKKRGILIERE